MAEPVDGARGAAPDDGGEFRRLPTLPEDVDAPATGTELELRSGAQPLGPAPASPLPAPLVAAAGGFIAGVFTYLLARLLDPRRRGRALGRRLRERDLEVAGRRSFLVDVHLLKR